IRNSIVERRKAKRLPFRQNADSLISDRREPSIDHEPPAKSEPIKDEERMTQAAVVVKERWEQERDDVERAHREEMRPIQEKLEKARKLVDQSGVGIAACDVARIMLHWPTWSQRKDWKPPVLVEDLKGGEAERDIHSVY